MVEIKIGSVRVRLCFGFFAVTLFACLCADPDPLGITAALVCCLLHETGHLSAMCLLSSPPDKICFYAGGIKIIPRQGCGGRGVSAVILLSGCAVNFALAAGSRLFGLDRLFEINLALGLFNLLPFSYFDGGRLISLFAPVGLRKALALLCAVPIAAAIFAAGGVSPSVGAVLLFACVAEFFMQ